MYRPAFFFSRLSYLHNCSGRVHPGSKFLKCMIFIIFRRLCEKVNYGRPVRPVMLSLRRGQFFNCRLGKVFVSYTSKHKVKEPQLLASNEPLYVQHRRLQWLMLIFLNLQKKLSDCMLDKHKYLITIVIQYLA